MNTMIEQLRTVLERLASAPEEQVEYLVRLGVAPLTDELALDLDDVFPMVRTSLPPTATAAVAAVDKALDSMSGSERARLWRVEALFTAPECDNVRRLARDALEQLSKLHPRSSGH